MARNKTAPAKPSLLDGWMGGLFLLLVTLLVYIPAMRAGYIWDDDKLLTENPAIKAGNGLYTIWCTRELNDWVPLTSTTFWIEWRFWKLNPAGFHVVNILLHGLNSILLWRVLRQLKIPNAWAAALLFAVHPVCVASVAWIAERKNTLSMAFYFISLIFYLRFDAEPKNKKWYGWALAAFALALLAKSSVGILPMVLLLCVWWRRGTVTKQDFLRVIPFFILTALAVSMSMWIQQRAMTRQMTLTHDNLLARLLDGSWAVWFYLWKLILPINLTMIYARWSAQVDAVAAYLPGLLLIGVLAVCWWQRKNWGRAGLFALGYFIIALGPVLGPVKLTYFDFSRVADHLQYLAIPGMLALAAVVLRKYFWIAVVPLCVLTWQYEKVFASSETIWLDNVAKNPASWTAYRDLGVIANQKGDLDGAIAMFKRSIEIQPDYPTAYLNLGVAMTKKSKMDEAIELFRKAIKVDGNYAIAHGNLATALSQKGQLDEALTEYKRAIELKPDLANAQFGMGEVLAVKGRRVEAVQHLREALRLQPSYPDAERLLQKLTTP